MKISEIIILQIPHTLEQHEYDFLASCISTERREQLSRFVYKEDAYRSLFAESLARAMIIRNLGMLNRDIHFASNPYGKPYLHGRINFHFNISHSGCWVVMIWGEEVVGIDIERIKEIDIGVAERFFSAEEYIDLVSKPGTERQEYFYDLWTLKESYIKALGTGLSTKLDTFSIRVLDADRIILNQDRVPYRFKQYKIDSKYKLSACSFSNQLPKSIQHYHYKNLIDDMI